VKSILACRNDSRQLSAKQSGAALISASRQKSRNTLFKRYLIFSFLDDVFFTAKLKNLCANSEKGYHSLT